MKLYIKLTNHEGSLISSNLPTELESYFDNCTVKNKTIDYCQIMKSKGREGKIINEVGSAYILTYDKELVSKPRYFKEKLEVYSEYLGEITTIRSKLVHDIQADNRRLIHNITSLNAHNIQELYSVVQEEKISHDYRKIKETVISFIEKDAEAVADAFLRIAKNSIAMKSEFTVFRKLDGGASNLQKQIHLIRKVILTVLHVFYQDFKEKDVHVLIDECNKALNFDFETMRVALHHIVDNTAKYIKPESQLRIKFTEDNDKKCFSVLFDMISLEINNSEVSDIINEGYSGINAKKCGKNGDGLGLAIVKKILKLNDAKLIIKNNQAPAYRKVIDGIAYEHNIFEIKFNNIIPDKIS